MTPYMHELYGEIDTQCTPYLGTDLSTAVLNSGPQCAC
jgi:hypothetical protein